GPYRWIRHPLYAFALLELLMLALLADSWFLLTFPIIGFVVFRLIIIPREEANLVYAFGERYEAYQRRSGALIPRLQIDVESKREKDA
ncbi:MAG TPA: methyltransferase, partial [Bellilinea sp.]